MHDLLIEAGKSWDMLSKEEQIEFLDKAHERGDSYNILMKKGATLRKIPKGSP